MIQFVTTHRHGCEQGARFCETFNEHRQPGQDLVVYVDGAPARKPYFRQLEDVDHWRVWMTQTRDELARRFGHKVFALHDAAEQAEGVDWLILVDSDVEWIAPIDLSFLNLSKAVAYLGRPWFRYSECGFVAYNLRIPQTRRIIRQMLELYMDADPITLQWGHDSAAFDKARAMHTDPHLWQDMTGHLDPATVEQKGLHVWPQSPLASVATHNKGPRRKAEAYR